MWFGNNNNKPVEVFLVGQDVNITNISTISGLTMEQILDKMVEKKIGIAASGSSGNSGTVKVVPSKLTLGSEFELGGTTWITVHITSTRVFGASKFILDTMAFDLPKLNTSGSQVEAASNIYSASDLKQRAREMSNIFNDAERAIMVAHPETGDLVSAMSYNELNGGFSYFNSNTRRICYDQTNGSAQYYWTRSPYGGSRVYCVSASGELRTYNPGYACGFRPCVALSL